MPLLSAPVRLSYRIGKSARCRLGVSFCQSRTGLFRDRIRHRGRRYGNRGDVALVGHASGEAVTGYGESAEQSAVVGFGQQRQQGASVFEADHHVYVS